MSNEIDMKTYIYEVRRRINKLFKPFIVRRPGGNCQVLFALTELDGLVDGILELVGGKEENAQTWCKVCKSFRPEMEDMCPNRDNVCVDCCLRCDPQGGCEFTGDRDSVEETIDSVKLSYCGNTGGRICREHFYNGHNSYGIKQCWSLKSAKRVERSIQLDVDDAAWTDVVTLSCFVPQYDRKAKWVREAGLIEGGTT